MSPALDYFTSTRAAPVQPQTESVTTPDPLGSHLDYETYYNARLDPANYLEGPLSSNPATRLRQMLARPGIVVMVAPGICDGISARCAIETGFNCLYQSGAATTASRLGQPDLAIATLNDFVGAASMVCSIDPTMPVIADADTGFGGPTMVARTVTQYAKAGVAALHIEDQVQTKRCGHLLGKQVVSREEFITRVRAAVLARDRVPGDSDFVIIARTDSAQVLGMEEAIIRLQLAAKAGADVCFIEGVRTKELLESTVAALAPKPVLVNVISGGLTPSFTSSEAEAMGAKIIIFSLVSCVAMVHAVRAAMQSLKKTGTDFTSAQGMDPKAFFTVMGLDAVVEFDARAGGLSQNSCIIYCDTLPEKPRWKGVNLSCKVRHLKRQGQVYDVTEFLDDHPGGSKIILKYAGQDATREYEPIHPPDAITTNLPPEKHLGPVASDTVERVEVVITDEEKARQARIAARPPLNEILNLHDFEAIARQTMTDKAWAYYSSAADDEITNRENHAAYHRHVLFVGVKCLFFTGSGLDREYFVTLRKLTGRQQFLAIRQTATALGKLGHPDGELNLTRAAAKHGLIQMDMRMKFEAEDPSEVTKAGSEGVDRSQGAARAISDALEAYDRGLAGVVLSNHGGRQLDFARSGIEILVEVVEKLKTMRGLTFPNDKFQLFVDGGVRRATDVLKAVALGATAVGVGRPFLYAYSTYGPEGIDKALQILHEINTVQDEFEMNMRLLGAKTIKNVVPSMVDASNIHTHIVAVPGDYLYDSNYENLQSATLRRTTKNKL
ncbi:hypothetical protein C0995_011916 [Termitomyces sp. Mi166|nr:hypothetical protein C0995_011916 [Termitomyces sp. Mi166\